jgi:carbamoyl-phosphate synthase large subunit
MNILVTAIGGGGHGDQVRKALQMAKPNGYRVIGADANPNCPQRQSVDSFEQLPLASDAEYLNAVVEVCRKWSIDVLFHGCEPEMRVISQNRKRFEDLGITLGMNSSSVIELCSDKYQTARVISELGMFMPRTETISVANSETLAKIDYLPVVVKPAKDSGGSSRILLAQTHDQLAMALGYLGLAYPSSEFIVQEYIGTPQSEFTVGILHDRWGEYIGGIGLRRDLTTSLSVCERVQNVSSKRYLGDWLVVSSGVSQGLLDRFPEVVEPCRLVAEAVGSRGPLNFQCRIHRNKIGIFEINPRLSGTTSLRAIAGFNEPDLMIRRNRLGKQELGEIYSNLPSLIYRQLIEVVQAHPMT